MPNKKLTITCLFVVASAFFCFSLSFQSRDKTDQPEKVMDVLGVRPGMVIGEVGAGYGYFTFKLARRVGESGKVYANDISESALSALRTSKERQDLTNLEIIRGEVEDPLLPIGALDMVFMVNVFHDLEKPIALLDNLLRSLKQGGLVVIIEQDPEKHSNASGHFYSKEDILRLIGQSRFELDRIETFLLYQNIYVLRPAGGKKEGRLLRDGPIS